MEIESRDKSIREVLTSGYYFVPRFQRAYSWKTEHVGEFWEDAIVENDGDYFIGSFVVFKESDGLFGIVDGQQRLTTITLALCAIRDAFESSGFPELATGLQLSIERRDINNDLHFVVRPSTSYPFLHEHIQQHSKGKPSKPSKPTTPEEENLSRAFEALNSKVNGAVVAITGDTTVSNDAKIQRVRAKLIAIRDKLLHLRVVFTKVGTRDDAYTIFETLNTRGEDLRLTDLVNTHITKNIKNSNKGLDSPRDKWLGLIGLLEQSQAHIKTDNFIHHFWLSKYQFTAKSKVFKAIKKTIKKFQTKDFLEELVADGKRYRAIKEPDYRPWEKNQYSARNSLMALNIFGVEQTTPLVLSLLRAYDAEALTLKLLAKALSSLESFHFCFTAVSSQSSSGGMSRMYARLGVELASASDGNKSAQVVKELRQKLSERLPTLETFRAAFVSQLRFSKHYTKDRKLVRYVLAKLHAYETKDLTPVNSDEMTIEHLCSQASNTTAETIANIGNLFFVPSELNKVLKDKPFDEKIEIIKTKWASQFDLAVLNAKCWSKTEIDARAKEMADTAFTKVWTI